MASWQDGPEYAPQERPLAFAVPDAAPLAEPARWRSLAAGAPDQKPLAWREDPRAAGLTRRPLNELAAHQDPPRDPRQQFDVVSSALTSGDSAWGAAHHGREVTTRDSFDPRAPILTAHWQGAAVVDAPVTPAASPAPLPQQLLQRITLPVVICLGLGVLIYPMAPILYLTAFWLSNRIMAKETQIRQTFLAGTAVLSLTALSVLADESAMLMEWWNIVGIAGAVCCAATGGIVAYLLRDPSPGV